MDDRQYLQLTRLGSMIYSKWHAVARQHKQPKAPSVATATEQSGSAHERKYGSRRKTMPINIVRMIRQRDCLNINRIHKVTSVERPEIMNPKKKSMFLPPINNHPPNSSSKKSPPLDFFFFGLTALRDRSRRGLLLCFWIFWSRL